MPIIATHELRKDQVFSSIIQDQIYNGLDCCVTHEVWQRLKEIPNPAPHTYSFTRAMQAPALEMMLRGFRVDFEKRDEWIERLEGQVEELEGLLSQYAYAVWDKPLNANSPKQVAEFFYDRMRLPQQWKFAKGKKTLSTDREALEKLDLYFYARPIIAVMLKIREIKKKLSVIQTAIRNGRFYTSYNIVGTETGRWSSSSSAYGDGSNAQNITGEIREMLVADDGWKICAIDLEQAESREVGWLLGTIIGDWRYLDACYAGDLHTITARMVWKDLGWNGGNDKASLKADREIAERPFYRHFSYRDMSKRGGHGTSYYGTPRTMSRHLKVPEDFMIDFQRSFFAAYGHDRWHRWVAQEIQTTNTIKNVFGQERTFFGRTNDDTTLREAIAHSPQSSTGTRLNLALWRVWAHLGNTVRIWAQVHDALYFLYRVEDEGWVIDKALSLIQVDIPEVAGHRLIVPGEAKIGWNWGNRTEQKDGTVINPFGLTKWKGKLDERQAPTYKSFLERTIR